MDIMEAIRTRRSVRSFDGQHLPDEMVETILEAAMLAPSAGNQQPWHFIVIKNRETLDWFPSFHPYSKMIRQAPMAILVCGDPMGKPWPDFWVQDCSAATQNILLAARGLGIGSVWLGMYPVAERVAGCRELLGIPDHIYPFALIPLGWPVKEFKTAERNNASLVHTETW